MPLYEYKCRKCGRRFEKIERVNSSTTKKCPHCGAAAERLLAAPAIQFKGTGWYVTDYAGKNVNKSGGDSSDAAPADASGKSDGSKSAEPKSGGASASSANEGSKKRKKS